MLVYAVGRWDQARKRSHWPSSNHGFNFMTWYDLLQGCTGTGMHRQPESVKHCRLARWIVLRSTNIDSR